MNLNLRKTTFVKVSDVVIPDVFNRRLRTGVDKLDRAFGNGILPGAIFTVTGSPGAGKTTFLLQVLDNLAKQGYKTAYASGEECVAMLASTCKRIGVNRIDVANETNIDRLLELTKEVDVLVIDSFSCLESELKSSRAHEKYCIQELCKASKDNECVIGVVLHITKGGMYKGGTIIPHSVDTVFHLHRDMVEGQPDDYVSMTVTKNRFGPTCEEQLLLTSAGFDWNFKAPEITNHTVAPKSVRKDQEMKELLQHKQLDVKAAERILKSTRQRASYILRELTLRNMFSKEGRGVDANYTKL
jgi:DNA repair protein RadA/Sms